MKWRGAIYLLNRSVSKSPAPSGANAFSRRRARGRSSTALGTLLGGLGCAVVLATSIGAQALPGLPPIRQAPELAFKVPGGEQKLLSQYKGKVVALEFILTTCPHCQAASKVMTKLQQELGPKGFQAIDVAVNTSDEAVVKDFIKNFQTGFVVGWLDAGSTMNNVLLTMKFMGYSINGPHGPQMPQQVLIDASGMIRYQTPMEGDPAASEEPVLRGRVMELLTSKPAAHKK